ncbi:MULTISPECIES: adenylate/guanylate cyclase domain-containing protein [unclassified Paenibacillus]|uniref:CHASE2 domain-containing protein n=1 Tax=unclassified Paenibacillus TaxID=185978 RepID=UPI001AE9A198|nr:MULTISPECIES: adenylate/guanylate cyclase domain-containing protein [unclassified Paenibacillus]MBP1154785.1 adenylate cyclase [Paenibacillus sp. PvP091]MBP1169831.1 adenylate cyclase [Paenibacillus sp. PvR098]MBP2440859.1 adenylate cyclase [Paenibacillus sp. PvP052]
MRNRMSRPGVIALGNGFIIFLCVLLLTTGALQVLSHQLYDFNMRQTMSQAPHEDIIVIGIDDQSIKEVGPYPWDRSIYAELISQLEEGGAKVIAFDIGLYTDSNNSESDKALAEELAKHQNIIIPSHANVEGEFQRTTMVKAGELIMAQSVMDPIPMFSRSVNRAHINATLDNDGVVRSNWLQIDTPQGVYPTLSLAIAQMGGYDVSRFLNLPAMDGRPQSEMLIRWDGKENDFETIPFIHVISGMVPPETFQDRLVLVGYTAPGSDQGITPVEKHMHLVYAHANTLNQILTGQVITPVNKAFGIVLAFLSMLLLGIITWKLKAIAGVILAFGAILVLFGGQFALFAFSSQYLDIMAAVACGIITYLGNLAMKTYFETKQKNYITKQFGRYISPDLVKSIASSEQEIQLGGISKELTVLFLDVRGFTPLSEELKPEEVVDFLNMMFNLITERALHNHGTIDKFIGDAAMILYNAPLDVPDHPYYAVKTAYEIQKGMEKVRADVLGKYGVTISVGIGINTGNVVVGNIGSYLRVDYTAIGDNVNTAARIESNTEPNQILVSEATYELTKEYFEYSFAGEKWMKGKSVPLKLFEVLGVKGAPVSAKDKSYSVS